MFRDRCGGGKGGGSSYDPQIGRAAAQSAAVAAKAEAFSEQFYKDVVTPLVQQQSKSSTENQERLSDLYGLNAEQMRTAIDRYKQYGIPAEARYYDMVDKYSEPAEMERQAQAAKGDLQTGLASQQGQMMRQFGALGIDPASPAAVAARSNQALAGAAMQATAMNRARNSARQLGMQLTADAANFGRGGQSGILQFGAGAQGNATSAFGIANAALGTGMQAGNSVLQGYQVAGQNYNNIMSNYAHLGAADIQAQAQSNPWAGIGQLGGMVLSQGLPAGFLSDARAKQDLEVVGELPSGVKVYSFRYRPEFREQWGHGTRVGVIAQEVATVIPDAVSTNKDGYMVVDYSKVS